MRTSFHHQPEAQHPKSPAIYTPAGRLPHLLLEHSAALGQQAQWRQRGCATRQITGLQDFGKKSLTRQKCNNGILGLLLAKQNSGKACLPPSRPRKIGSPATEPVRLSLSLP